MRLLGAADPLRHRRLGHEERVGDLGRRQAADGAQRQRDRRRRRERRMAAHEQQDQRVVLLGRARRRRRAGATCSSAGACATTTASRRRRASSRAEVIGHAPRGDLDQPAARVVGHALARPLQRRREQRLLDRVLGRGEVAEAPDTAPSTCGASSRSRCSPREVRARRGVTCRSAGALITCAHLDRHVQRHAARPGRRRGARRDLVGPLRALARRRSSSRRGTPWPPGTARR